MENLRLDAEKIIVTGGAGFIGSYISEKLVQSNYEVRVIDNLTSGKEQNLFSIKNKKKFSLIKNDIGNLSANDALKDIKTVFHLAAYPEVRTGFDHPELCYEENINNTFKLLEQIRKSNVDTIVFSSSSTVYGEPQQFPTSENYGPLIPISIYGASKLACEALLLSYGHTYGLNVQIFRFANIVGKRSNHGIIWDFINKLSKNPYELEVLGDGTQSKSYLHVDDCVDAIFHCMKHSNKKQDIFNIGNNDEIDVLAIADIVCNSMNLSNVKIKTTGGVDKGRGWIGDVKKMKLDITKIKKMGWSPNLSSEQSLESASMELVKEMEMLTIGS